MTTYYAICNVHGPISKRIEDPSVEPQSEWIDEAYTDAEDDLNINGEGMTHGQFEDAMKRAGARLIHDSVIHGDLQIFAKD